jgi:AbrB family looped-hinge helix DNA binding protein
MAATIDAAGRLVIPKAIREAAKIGPDTPLEIRFRDGRIEIEPRPLPVDVVQRGKVSVAVPRADVPPLLASEVDATRSRLRD